MLTRKLKFYQTLEENPCNAVVSSDEISAIQSMYSGPCPVGNVASEQYIMHVIYISFPFHVYNLASLF